MHPKLSFEQAPPISVPFRFLMTAPWFGVLAGLLLLVRGGDGWASRWQVDVLVWTHLLAAGFMLQVMLGALLQFVPVATGGNIWRPRWVAAVAHPLITLAVLVLAATFLFVRPAGFIWAAGLFFAGLSPFIVATAVALLRTPAQGATVPALRLALVGLLVAVSLGGTLALVLGGGLSVDVAQGRSLPALVNVHAAWGLAGWALMLVMGVSFLVVPMFQLTPAYPAPIARGLPWLLLAVLLFWSAALLFQDGSMAMGSGTLGVLSVLGVQAAGLLVAAIYAGVTLFLQHKRRRRLADVTLLYWRCAMSGLLSLVLSWLVFQIFPVLGEQPQALLWLGVLAFMGVFVPAINGMLYKIVPFLIWLHLQQLGSLKTLPPNMKQMISERRMRGQFVAHLLACGLSLAMLLWPVLSRLAGVALMVSFAWLAVNLIQAGRLYLDFRRRAMANPVDRTDAAAGHHGS